MDNATHLGLDVHKQTISVAVLRPGGAEPDERTIANTPEALRLLIRRGRFEHPVASYEAGPTGYETHRVLGALGVPCDVVAPTMIPRRAGARVKTDPIDARNLARLHRAGELTAIRVPSPTEEAIRDLVRVREDIKDDRRTTQHRVKGFLLRQGRRYPGRDKGWSDKFPVGTAPALRGACRRRRLPPLSGRARRAKDPARHDHHRDRRRRSAATAR
jgi:transposase